MNERLRQDVQQDDDDQVDNSYAVGCGGTEHEAITCTRCDAAVTSVPVECLCGGTNELGTGIIGETFTRAHGSGTVYLCEPCADWLLEQCHFGLYHPSED